MRRKIYNKNVGGLMSSNIDESLSPFEQALKQFDMLQNYKEQRLEKLKEQKEETNYTRAAKGATFNDFLEMVKTVDPTHFEGMEKLVCSVEESDV